MAGMTDYTGVSMGVILAHLRDWRDETARCMEALTVLQAETERHREQLNRPNDIIAHLRFFIDLFGRYLGDFDRLLVELPRLVTAAHVEVVQQIYDSASREEELCVRFSRDHIDRQMKDEGLRWLVDDIYRESRSMMIDYHDLSNLVPRLRTFVGTAATLPVAAGQQRYDLFLSYASEDKNDIARPLYEALRARGVTVWFDEAVLGLGDSLRRKIDEGLRICRFGLVVLSPHFFAKQWPQRELDGLVARETTSGEKAILPVWHGVEREAVLQYSATLADRVAANSSEGLPSVVAKILRALGQ